MLNGNRTPHLLFWHLSFTVVMSMNIGSGTAMAITPFRHFKHDAAGYLNTYRAVLIWEE